MHGGQPTRAARSTKARAPFNLAAPAAGYGSGIALTVPVYLFTYHAYRTWNPDHPRGFVQDQERGYQPPNKALAAEYDRAATAPPALFDGLAQDFLVRMAYDFCVRRGYRLHAIATDPTHVHVVVSWRDGMTWTSIRQSLKNLLSLGLNRMHPGRSEKWFSRGASRKRVRDAAHLRHLLETYLPRHRGLRWTEGDAPPDPVPYKYKSNTRGENEP